MTEMTAADILDGAKTVLKANGFHQGDLVDYEQWDAGTPPQSCRVDPAGALNVAAGEFPDAPLTGAGLVADAARFLADAIKFESPTSVRAWIDHPLRTLDNVFMVLDRAIGYAVAAESEVAS